MPPRWSPPLWHNGCVRTVRPGCHRRVFARPSRAGPGTRRAPARPSGRPALPPPLPVEPLFPCHPVCPCGGRAGITGRPRLFPEFWSWPGVSRAPPSRVACTRLARRGASLRGAPAGLLATVGCRLLPAVGACPKPVRVSPAAAKVLDGTGEPLTGSPRPVGVSTKPPDRGVRDMFQVIGGAAGAAAGVLAPVGPGSVRFRVDPDQVFALANRFDLIAADIEEANIVGAGSLVARAPGADQPSIEAADRLIETEFGDA